MKTYREYENKELLDLLVQGDEAAFTELYNRFWKKLFVVAYNRLREVQTAEDIVHDLFASLWLNRTKLEIGSLDNYFATAVKYMVLAKIRKKAYERDYSKNANQAQIIEFTADTSLDHKRILEIVKTRINSLPEKCRLIFKYSRNEGMTVKQIATQLNISPKTVENQLNKALRQIKLATKSFLNFF